MLGFPGVPLSPSVTPEHQIADGLVQSQHAPLYRGTSLIRNTPPRTIQ